MHPSDISAASLRPLSLELLDASPLTLGCGNRAGSTHRMVNDLAPELT